MSPRDAIMLMRPRIVFLVAVTTAVGFYMSSSGTLDWERLLLITLGISLITGAAGTLNQLIEHDVDALMERTSNRPLPSRRVSFNAALIYGILLAVLGTIVFWWERSYLALAFAHVALFSYLFIYTPLKKKTPMCTLLGAVPGALPPLIGSVAANGELTATAWILFGLLYLWQIPHFLAIAWMYKEDYAKGGLRMLPVVDESGKKTAELIFASGFLYSGLAILPYILNLAGAFYLAGTLILAVAFQWTLYKFWKQGTRLHARQIVLASVFVLPMMFLLIALNKL